MRSKKEVEEALSNVDTEVSEYPGMTYEQGVEETLLWVLGEIESNEFEFSK